MCGDCVVIFTVSIHSTDMFDLSLLLEYLLIGEIAIFLIGAHMMDKGEHPQID